MHLSTLHPPVSFKLSPCLKWSFSIPSLFTCIERLSCEGVCFATFGHLYCASLWQLEGIKLELEDKSNVERILLPTSEKPSQVAMLQSWVHITFIEYDDDNDNGDDDYDDNKILLVQMTNVLWGSLSIGPHPPQESQESIYRLAISGVGVHHRSPPSVQKSKWCPAQVCQRE